MIAEASLPLVEAIMSREVVTIHSDTTIREAVELMISDRVSAVPVVNDDHRCVGILSLSDLIEMVYEFDKRISNCNSSDSFLGRILGWEEITEVLGEQSVMETMTADVECLTADQSCRIAAQRMIQLGVHRLPVLDAEGSLVGIVSTSDITRMVAQES